MFLGPVVLSELPEVRPYPALKQFLRRQVDMQIADLRMLFRLPVEALDPNVGCNLTTAATLMNVISGFSRWFFHTEEAAEIARKEEERSRPLSACRFKGFVKTYWPKIEPEPSSEVVAHRLYEVRNSLVHDLGVREDPKQEHPRHILLRKACLSLDDIVVGLERNELHPISTGPVIQEQETGYAVHLAGVYWALHRMFRCAVQDRPKEIDQAIRALIFLRSRPRCLAHRAGLR
jgi:hypothetical protein